MFYYIILFNPQITIVEVLVFPHVTSAENLNKRNAVNLPIQPVKEATVLGLESGLSILGSDSQKQYSL